VGRMARIPPLARRSPAAEPRGRASNQASANRVALYRGQGSSGELASSVDADCEHRFLRTICSPIKFEPAKPGLLDAPKGRGVAKLDTEGLAPAEIAAGTEQTIECGQLNEAQSAYASRLLSYLMVESPILQ